MLNPRDIFEVKFTPVRLREGYDQNEVDSYLDDVAKAWQSDLQRLAQAQAQVKDLELRNRSLTEAPTAQVPAVTSLSPSGAAEKILVLAQETADKHVADAKAEAERIKAEARTEADGIKGQAVLEAQQIRTQGLADKQRALDDLEARHGQVTNALGQLQQSGASIREALREALNTYERQVPSS